MVGGRWAIFVHDPDGDSGEGRIVGPFYEAAKADAKAATIARMAERAGDGIECIVLPVLPSNTSAQAVAAAVMDD